MAIDDPSILPVPPPPRPAAREAAFSAAMRRFDGEGAPAQAAPPRTWVRRPQWGMAMAASLVFVIGVPAAMIAIRSADLDPAPPEAQQPTMPAARTQTSAGAEAAAAVEALPPAESLSDNVEIPKTERLEPNRFRVLPDDEAKSLASSSPVVAPAAAEPAAPASPPPPAPQSGLAESSEADEASNIVVTGSSVGSSQLARQRSAGRAEKGAADRALSNGQAAPDWVLRDRSYADFLSRLQSAVGSGDRNRVAGLVRYPLRVNFTGGAKTYRNPGAVIADYDAIFTPKVTSAILAQRAETLFGRDQGVMVGSGQVWFDHVCNSPSCDSPGPVRITAVNP